MFSVLTIFLAIVLIHHPFQSHSHRIVVSRTLWACTDILSSMMQVQCIQLQRIFCQTHRANVYDNIYDNDTRNGST